MEDDVKSFEGWWSEINGSSSWLRDVDETVARAGYEAGARDLAAANERTRAAEADNARLVERVAYENSQVMAWQARAVAATTDPAIDAARAEGERAGRAAAFREAAGIARTFDGTMGTAGDIARAIEAAAPTASVPVVAETMLRQQWDGFCANPAHGEMCDWGGTRAECRPQPAATPPKETR